MFLTAAHSGPAAEAGRIPLNGNIQANENYQVFGDPPFMVFVNTGGTADTTLGPFTLAVTAIVTLRCSLRNSR